MIAKLPINYVTIPDGEDTGFQFDVDFTQDYSTIEPSNTSLTLHAQQKDEFIEHIETKGRYAGIDVTLLLEDDAGNQLNIDMVNTLEFKIGEDEVNLPLKPKFNPNNFQSMANGMSFRLLEEEGLLTNDVFVYADRIIVSASKGIDIALISGNLLTTTLAFADATNDLISSAADFVQAVSINPADLAAASIRLAGNIAKFALVLISLIKLWKQLIKIILPAVREYKCIKLNKLVELCCSYLGYTLQSTLLYDVLEKYTIAPVPKKETDQSFLQTALGFNIPNSAGIPLENDIFSTFGQLLEWMRSTFNAKVRIINNTVIIENELFYLQNPNLDLENFLTNQDERQDFNTFENKFMFKSKLVKLEDDVLDYWTLDSQIKRHYEVQCRMNLSYELRLLEGGLEEISALYAFGIRKNELTFVEKFLSESLGVVDSILNFFGGNVNLESKITNRIGAFITSTEVFGVTKMLWLNDDGRQPEDYKDYVGAQFLYQLFHEYREPEKYNWEVREYEMPCTDEIFLSLLNNNVFNSDGKLNIVRVQSYLPEYGTNKGGRLSLKVWVESEVKTGVTVELINNGNE